MKCFPFLPTLCSLLKVLSGNAFLSNVGLSDDYYGFFFSLDFSESSCVFGVDYIHYTCTVITAIWNVLNVLFNNESSKKSTSCNYKKNPHEEVTKNTE